jgi:raffinose/stachyose/melibiose transport system permease protein
VQDQSLHVPRATESAQRGQGAEREASTSRTLLARVRDARLQGWLFVAPALAAYAVFVLWPLLQTFRYSLYQWDGVLPARWVGLANFKTVFSDHELLWVLGHAFQLIIFFSGIPVALGLVVATVMRRVASRRVSTVARAVLFLPQVVPLVAAGIAWSWVLSSTGVVNQALKAVGLGGVTRAWLGDFGTALPAVGVIGAWVLLGLCTVLLLAGMSKIDPTLYEAAQLDGAGPVREFISITLPSLRQEIGVCVTVTVIAALSAFDIVYISTRGGPGTQTMVPGLEIYQLAFFNREVGLASALAVVLMVLVLVCILPIQWLTRKGSHE